MPANMGFPSPPPVQGPSFYDKLMSGLLGQPSSYGGLLDAEDQKRAQQQALMAMGPQLMSASGPSPYRTSLGQALGPAIMAGQQAQQASGQDALQTMLLKSQIDKNNRGTENEPNSVREYQYAKQNGFQGTFQDWITAGGQSSRPSSVQEWDFYSNLPDSMKRQYLEMKRNPNFVVKDVNTVPTVVQPSVIGGTTTTPLSNQASEAEAAAEKKRQESAAAALGGAQGTIAGGIETRGANAVTTQGALDVAEPLIDIATGSAAGAARDKVAAFFGGAPDGAKAIAALKVLQANLMTSMPRMEGPQSDRDVQLYREAAGQIGDPTVPAEIKKAAVRSIREIQQRYVQRASGVTPSSSVVRKRFNPATGKIE